MSGSFDPYRTWLGIAPEEQPPNHYRLLGIPPFEDQPEAIEHAADQRMAHLRTLQAGEHPALSQRLLNEVATARVCLLNAAKKAAYDRQLRQQSAAKSPARKPPVVAHAASAADSRAADQETVEWTGLGQLGEYRLLEKLGAGGMGEVYKAVHTEMQRVVAVKVLPPGHLQNEHAIARFKREIKAVAQLSHPNVVQAFDAREIEGTRFLVMEYVEGMDLRAVAGRLGPLPIPEACELILQAALGLQCAHEHGLVHRDIKPSNLMLSHHGVVKLLDLGLARPQVEKGAEDEVTGTGEAMGTADFMAPEQAQDSRSVDIRADLYSLGCTLYRLIAGRPPFSGPKYDTTVKKLMGHIQHPPPKITRVRRDVSKQVEVVLGRLLAKDPAKRLGTPAEVAEALGPLSVGADLPGLYAAATGKVPAPPLPAQAEVRTQSSQSSGLTRFLEKVRGAAPAKPGHSTVAAPQQKLPAWAGYAAIGAVALLIILAWGVMSASRSSKEEPVEQASSLPGSREKRSAATPPETQHLVLHWPESERTDARLEIDRWPRKTTELVDPKDPDRLKMEVTPGVHKVWIARRGFEPFEQTVKVEPGKDLVIRPEWGKPPEVAVVPPSKPEPEGPKPQEKPPEKPQSEKPQPKDVAEKPPMPEEKPKPPEIDPALKRRQELDAKYAQAVQPVEALVAKWDFAGAVALLAKIEFDEPELMSRRNARGRGLQRLVPFKSRIIAKINAAQPPLRKSSLMIKGANGDVVKADDSGITTRLAGGKTESLAWDEIGQEAPKRLVRLAIDRQKPDDLLAAGLLLLACGDANQAEQQFEKARELGADIGPCLAPLAAAAFAEAKGLLEKKQFPKAEAALAALEQKYGKTPWFEDNTAAFDAARTAARTGIAEAEAEKLYGQAAELFNKKELFDLRPLVQKLKAEYAQTPAVTDASRKPPFAELEKAVADLGKIFTVRLDGKGDFKSIQAAIDAAPPNSLIEIQDNGPYNEKIRVNKEGLTLRGRPGCWPVITSVGQLTGFPKLMQVSSPQVRLERLVLVHGAPAGPDQSALSGESRGLSIRSCIIGGKCAANVSGALVENSVFASGLWGKAVGRDCFCYHGVHSGMKLENSIISFGSSNPGLKDCELRRCTIRDLVTIAGPNVTLVDCIIPSITSSRPRGVIEHCNVYKNPPFKDQAKPGKGCFGGNPQFADPSVLDYRLMPTSPCRGKASDGGDVGCRYTPEMIEIIQVALELRARGIIDLFRY